MTQDSGVCLSFLLVICISISTSERFKVHGPAHPVVAVAGENVILPCYLKPNISAEDLEVRWFREDFFTPVHLYINKKNDFERQEKSYQGRASLFKKELSTGNTSLKLLEVRGSDEGSYNCFVEVKKYNEEYSDEISIQLSVKGHHGKQPVISIEGYSIGGVGLVCEATGWYPQPELIWRSSEGHSLPAEPAETLRDSLDLFTVRRRIIAQRDTSRVMCRVQLLQFSQEKDIEIHIRDEIFPTQNRWIIAISMVVLLCVIIVAAVSIFFYRKKGELEAQLVEERAIRVIMIGESWGGKSLSANRILGCSSFSSQCEECQTEKAVVDGRLMTVVITPAWEENKPLEETKKEKIRESFRHCLPGPHAILLVASARTALGDKSDWSTEQANVELLGGSRVWAHALVLLTCTDERSKRRLQDKGKTLGIVQRNCGGRYYVFNFKSDSRDQISNLLREITQIVEKQGGGFFLVHEEKRGSMVSISLEE